MERLEGGVIGFKVSFRHYGGALFGFLVLDLLVAEDARENGFL